LLVDCDHGQLTCGSRERQQGPRSLLLSFVGPARLRSGVTSEVGGLEAWEAQQAVCEYTADMAPNTDQLALERTRLANERTLLSYVRTALGAAGAGVGVLELVDAPALGWLLVVAAAGLLLIGIGRFLAVRRRFEP